MTLYWRTGYAGNAMKDPPKVCIQPYSSPTLDVWGATEDRAAFAVLQPFQCKATKPKAVMHQTQLAPPRSRIPSGDQQILDLSFTI